MEWSEDFFFNLPCPGVTIHLPPKDIAERFSLEVATAAANAGPNRWIVGNEDRNGRARLMRALLLVAREL